MINVVYAVIQIVVLVLAAPLVNGIIKKVKALTQKRKGAPLLQMYYDLFKMCKKTVVVSDVSSWILKVTPYIVFSTAVAAREAMISSLIEPSILVTLFTIGLTAKSTALFPIMNFMKSTGTPLIHPVYIIAFITFFIIIITETSRIPVDDPSTHLELTELPLLPYPLGSI